MAGGSNRWGVDSSADDATTAVMAHGLLNVLSVVKATAATLRDNYDEFVEQPDMVMASLQRMARNADLAVALVEDLMRGIPTDVVATLDELGRR